MESQIYFIRHAEADNSYENDRLRPLTKDGINESIKLCDRFNDIKIDDFYSSPYLRAINTIEPLAKKMNKKIITVENLREVKMPFAEMKNLDEYCTKHWNNFSFKYYNCESFMEVQKRNIDVIEKLILQNQEKSIIIGTHGIALSTIINYYDKNFQLDAFKRLIPKRPYIICFMFDNNGIKNIVEKSSSSENIVENNKK